MTRPLFIHHDSHNLETSEHTSTNHQSDLPNEEEENFHLKRIGSSVTGETMLALPSGCVRSKFQGHNQSNQTDHLLGNYTSEVKERHQTHTGSDPHNAIDYSETGLDSQNLTDDILEYDEDNVIVIDLDDIRNNPSRETGVQIPSTNMEPPKRRVEIKRQVYYDDSDLFSPPPPPLNENEDVTCDKFPADISINGSNNYIDRSTSLCISRDLVPNASSVSCAAMSKNSSTESSSATVNSQNNEVRCQNVNQVSLPPPIQPVLDKDSTNQERYYDDADNDYSQKDIVQPPSPFSERSCSSSVTTGASSIKQSHCLDATSDVKTANEQLNKTLEQSIMHHATILVENDQPVFYETTKFERQKGGLDNHSQLTLSSISSETVCQHGDPLAPLPITTSEMNDKINLHQSNIEHPTTLPPVKVCGRNNLSSALFSSSHKSVGNEDLTSKSNKTSVHKNSHHHQSESREYSPQTRLENEPCEEYYIYNNNNIFNEGQKVKRDRPNKLFPSVPTSSSVIINNNSCAASPSASAKTQGENVTGKLCYNGN